MSQLANDWMNLLVVLPPADRAEIARRLIESLDEPADPDWETAWAEELQKRAERMKNGAVRGIPFEEVMAKLRRGSTEPQDEIAARLAALSKIGSYDTRVQAGLPPLSDESISRESIYEERGR